MNKNFKNSQKPQKEYAKSTESEKILKILTKNKTC